MRKLLIICCLVGLFGGCSSNFLKEYSQDLAKVESLDDLDEVLAGSGYLPTAKLNENDFFKVSHFMSDELDIYKATNGGDKGIRMPMFGWHTWQQDVGLPFEGSARTPENKDWQQAYTCINICNMVLASADDLPANNTREELQQKRIKGEAHFLRALYYFTLANLYGQPYCARNLNTPAVPIKLTEYVEDKDYTVNTVQEVYVQVLTDLDEANAYLKDNEVKNLPYRADITAVYLLKSRVYLYMQDWEKAREYADSVLMRHNSLLDLNAYTSGSEVFTKTSPEMIFSMGGYALAEYVYNRRGSDGTYPNYIISDDLRLAFDGENDWRTQYYIMLDNVGGYSTGNVKTDEWVFVKAKGWEAGYKESSDHFMFRTAEAYLNAAEAAAYSGDEAAARQLLKTLRDNRLKVSSEITASGKGLIDLIRRERQCELCLEGHRWFDLRRYRVCEKFPYSKKITHYHATYQDYPPKLLETKSYTLKEDEDAAYTLSLPKEVVDFQNTLASHQRPLRSVDPETPGH